MPPVNVTNPHLKSLDEDVLYHLGLGSGSHDLRDMFGDVKFVCMGGTPQRMESFAKFITQEIGYKIPTGTTLYDISAHSHRYAMYKVGPVLAVSHGMGVPSLSILLHEMIKLMGHAGVEDPIFIRLGTSGGIGLEGGAVVVTSEALNNKLKPCHEGVILGKLVEHPTALDKEVADTLVELGKKMDFQVVSGKTMCTDDFYEGQGRIDGAFCNYTLDDKMKYLQHISEMGVKNIEMEASCFAAMTHRAGIKAAIVCVTILNRLNGDQVTSTKETLTDFQSRPQKLVAELIKKHVEMTEKRALSNSKGHHLVKTSSQYFRQSYSSIEDYK